jgi:hypothetical protein
MRGFEVLFADQKGNKWYGVSVRIISAVVVYCAVAAMVWFYFNDIHMLGFDPK